MLTSIIIESGRLRGPAALGGGPDQDQRLERGLERGAVACARHTIVAKGISPFASSVVRLGWRLAGPRMCAADAAWKLVGTDLPSAKGGERAARRTQTLKDAGHAERRSSPAPSCC